MESHCVLECQHMKNHRTWISGFHAAVWDCPTWRYLSVSLVSNHAHTPNCSAAIIFLFVCWWGPNYPLVINHGWPANRQFEQEHQYITYNLLYIQKSPYIIIYHSLSLNDEEKRGSLLLFYCRWTRGMLPLPCKRQFTGISPSGIPQYGGF